jgi:hypothetical protein
MPLESASRLVVIAALAVSLSVALRVMAAWLERRSAARAKRAARDALALDRQEGSSTERPWTP